MNQTSRHRSSGPLRVCVFCGSRTGAEPRYRQAAAALGARLARAHYTLVYGGSSIGLMTAVADAALAADGEVIGVIPRELIDREVAHARLTRLEVVDSMSERKRRMEELSDAFVVLPGGIGTLDELFEVWTWRYLGYHLKPCVLVDLNGFYVHLIDHVDRLVEKQFLGQAQRDLITVVTDVDAAMACLEETLR